jgi:hypothetical protein
MVMVWIFEVISGTLQVEDIHTSENYAFIC